RAFLFGLVVLTDLMLAVNICRFNTNRPLPWALEAARWPIISQPVDDSVVKAVARHGGGRFIQSSWSIPYWNVMARFKAGKYSVGGWGQVAPLEKHPDQKVLNILSFPRSPKEYGSYVPVQIPGKTTAGLSYLGQLFSSSGPE